MDEIGVRGHHGAPDRGGRGHSWPGSGRSCTGTSSSVRYLIWPRAGSVCLHARVCLGMREGRPGGLRQSVGPSGFQAKFHQGFPKSGEEVRMSSFSLAASPAQSLKNEPIVCMPQGPSCKGPGGQLAHLVPSQRSQLGPGGVGRPSYSGAWG